MKRLSPLHFLPGLSIILFLLGSCQDPGKTGAANNESPGGAGAEASDTTVALELFAEGFTYPLTMEQGPDGNFYIVDQIGVIKVADPEGHIQEQAFLDIRDQIVELKTEHEERGLLGLALHPDFAENGRFFVHYSAPLRAGAPAGWSHTKHVSEFRRDPEDAMKADAASERIIMQIDEPQSNHNGGTLVFGPDNFLYLSLGDGGGANDRGQGHVGDWYQANEGGNGQDEQDNLLGSIIRININEGEPYGLAEDSPLATQNSRRELYATGLRNPYRFSFDRGGDHALYVGDVGQKLWEEINLIEPGGNYGWNVKEGFSCFNAGGAAEPLDSCPDRTPWGAELLDPIIVFPHEETPGYVPYGIAVIGGYVYRGDLLDDKDGQYFFGTWTRHHGSPAGAIYRAEQSASQWVVHEVTIGNTEDGALGRYLTGFAEDDEGELYVLTAETEGPGGNTGKIYRIVAASDQNYAVSSSRPDDYDAVFSDDLTEAIFQDYLHLRTAFVNSDVEEVNAVAGELTERLTAQYAGAQLAAQTIVDADELEQQRVAFHDLTKALEPMFENDLKEGVIYKIHCPMAFDNEGADWLSDSDQIRNPYFGERMLTCGTVVDTIR